MEVCLVWAILTVLVGSYSRSKGLGFASGFWWAFFLSPVIGALVTAIRQPRLRTLPTGATIAREPRDPDAPRPALCAVLIVVIVLGIVCIAGCATSPMVVSAPILIQSEIRTSAVACTMRVVGDVYRLESCPHE